MYLQHFNLSENPFTIAPNPHYLYLSEQHREALAHLTYGLNEKNGSFILLTGEVGTGKTTVCRCLLEQIPKDVYVALVLNPLLNEQELLETICTELHITYPEQASTKVLIDKLNAWLLAIHGQGKHAVVIIEEAQNLGAGVLEQLRLLTNLETNEQKLLQFILIGQPELLIKLAQPQLRQLSQRIVARYHLNALAVSEVRAYILHRLKVVGGNAAIFPAAVSLRIAQLSKGVPRIINLLCDRALLGCYAQNKQEVSLQILEQAALEVFGDAKKTAHWKRGPKKPNTWFRRLVFGGVGVVLLVGGFYAVLGQLPFLASTYSSKPNEAVHSLSATKGGEPVSASTQTPKSEPATSPPRSLPVANLAPPRQSIDLKDGVWREADAYRVLLGLWGIDFSAEGQRSPCDLAQDDGLDCWHKQGRFLDIQRTNRPAVLKMISQQGQVFFITLVGRVNRNQWEIASAAMRQIVARKQIEKFWTGEYTLLWKRPRHFSRTVYPGDQNPMVGWLNQQMAMIHGERTTPRLSLVYGNNLMREVRQLQRRCGLQVDGLLGRETIILLNTITSSSPVLSTTRRNALCPKVNV